MGSRSAAWIVAAFLGGVVVTLSAIVIAGTGTAVVQPTASATPARAVQAQLRIIHGQAGRTIVIGQAPVAAGPLAGCPAANLQVISGRPSQVKVRVGRLSGVRQRVIINTITPAKTRRIMIVRLGNGQAVIRLIGPPARRVVFRSPAQGPITIRGKLIGPGQVVLGPGQVVLGPGQVVLGPRQVVLGPGQVVLTPGQVVLGSAGQAAIAASPACGRQVVFLP